MKINTCKWCGKEFWTRNVREDVCDSRQCQEKDFEDYLKKNNFKITYEKIPNKYTSWGDWECNFDFEGVYKFFFGGKQEKFGMIIETQPPFQRDLVWTQKQKKEWIEHVLRNGKSALVIYCNCPSWNGTGKSGDEIFDKTIQVVDGQQRLSAIKDFVEGKIKVFGKYYYKDIFLRGFNNLKINVNDLKSKEEVLKLYIEMNSGGTQHTKKELDKAKHLLEELNKGEVE